MMRVGVDYYPEHWPRKRWDLDASPMKNSGVQRRAPGRVRLGEYGVFLVNHVDEERTVSVPAGKRDLLTGRTTAESLALGAFGVAVLRW